MMKQIAIALGVLALLVGVMAYNVWRAGTETIAHKPGVVEQGRMDLHTQLVQAELREAEIEKVYWNAPEKLAVLIHSHEQRVEKLNGNPAGSEIVAHDMDAIARLQKRIEAIAAERAAAAEAQAASAQDAAGTNPSNP